MTLTDIRILFGKLWRATMISSDTQHALAAQAFAFWRPKCRLALHAHAILADIDGEVSFESNAVGDHGEAHGIAQWHAARQRTILVGTGIDVNTARFADQLIAMEWEMTKGPYKAVWPSLMATETLWSAVAVLVSRYEQSGQQARDIKRRVGLAEKWASVFPTQSFSSDENCAR